MEMNLAGHGGREAVLKASPEAKAEVRQSACNASGGAFPASLKAVAGRELGALGVDGGASTCVTHVASPELSKLKEINLAHSGVGVDL